MRRQPTVRSRAYPAINLREAVEILRRQVEDLGPSDQDRDSIAQALGYRNGSIGAVARKIAALGHFGFLRKAQGRYGLTELGHAVVEGQDRVHREVFSASLREAFLQPKLFSEIIDKYEAKGRVPRLLPHSLGDHGISEKAAHHAAEVFMASAQFAGVLSPDGRFLDRIADDSWERDAAPEHGSQSRVPEPFQASPVAQAAQYTRIFLTDGKSAELGLPRDLNLKDIQILMAQIEVFKTQIESNAVEGALLRFPG